MGAVIKCREEVECLSWHVKYNLLLNLLSVVLKRLHFWPWI